jgi:uncharacterized protein YacL
MYNIVKEAHSGVAYLVIILLLIASLNAIIALATKREFVERDRKIGLFTLIFSHIQLLLGLVSLGSAMKDSTLRLYALEHPLVNIIAIVLITIGWSKHKKIADGNAKFKPFAIFYTLGLILILSRIPWAVWFA